MRLDPGAVPAALANRVLAREQWARDSLRAHSGRSFKVVVASSAAKMRIDDSGSIESAQALEALRISRCGFLRSRCPRFSPTRSAGTRSSPPRRRRARHDAQGAGRDAALVRRARIREALGPIAGQFVADAGRRMLAFPGYAGERVGDSVASYVRDEVPLAITTMQAGRSATRSPKQPPGVDALAARVDALGARLDAKPPKAS
jgi:ubiquinone biosynthesis protein UbiJ